MADADQSNLTTLTVDLLSAYVANNNVEHSAIPDLIKSTHAALKTVDSPEPPAPEEPEYKPAVSVRQSLKSDAHIISLIDGKPYQTLKRHLKGHNLTPDEYRARYGLPKTYPMVAPAYSAARREIAKKLGLGNRAKDAAEQAAAPVESKAPAATPPKSEAPAPKARKAAVPKTPPAVPVKADAPVPTKAKPTPKSKTPAKPKRPSQAATPEPKPADPPVVAAAKPAPKAPAAATPKSKAAAPAKVAAPKAKTPKARTPKANAPASAEKSAPARRAAKTTEPAS